MNAALYKARGGAALTFRNARNIQLLRRAPLYERRYATLHQSASESVKDGKSNSHRRQVTVVNDDGRVRWTQLTAGEKVARSAQQSFNFVVVLVGIVLTGTVFTFLYREVFSSESKTSYFNRAVDRVKKDRRCVQVLGEPSQIAAYGEASRSRWARNRSIASRKERDAAGNEHLLMHFNVEGPRTQGIVRLHLTKAPNKSNYQYKYLALDVPGHQRIYLEKAEPEKTERASGKMFGIRWW